METDGAAAICAVCGGSAPSAAMAECNWCGNRYHLNQRNDIEGKDCGQVWIDEQFLALQFACNSCLTAQEPSSAPDSDPSVQAATPKRALVTRQRRYRKRE